MPNESIKVNYSQTQNWGNGFQGKISITNNSDSNLVNWDLEFDLPNEISKIWDAKIVENDNGNYTIEDAGWNREIAAGKTIDIGFIADGNASSPKNFDIDGSQFSSPSTSDSIISFSNPNLSPNMSLGKTYQGRATFYDAANPAGGKVAGGYDNISGSALGGIVAINNVQWNGSEAAGGFLEVSGPKQRKGAAPITVQIADLLYERADGLDMSAEAFAKVADPVSGVVNIEYKLVDPGDNFRTPYGHTIGDGIVVESISGANPYYGAIRLNNHRYPVESVQMLTEGGGKVALNRDKDNRFFVNDKSGIYGAQDLLVTDVFGQQVTLDNIDLTSGNSKEIFTGEQFGSL